MCRYSRRGVVVRWVMALSDGELARICRARERLRDLAEPYWPVDRIAREAGISHFHFIRQFHAVFGFTPHQYRIDARLRQARLLLASGNYSVTDACMAVGFESVGAFS